MHTLKNMVRKLLEYGHMIKFSHSLFALPFALSGAILAHQVSPITMIKIFWIVMAMLGARSAAMGFNRLVDKDIDGRNPRTKDRHLPSGRLQEKEIILFIAGFSALFIFAAYHLNMLCFYLSPLTLAVLLLYSYTKRFTYLSHYVLGLALGISPLGAWIAVTGTFALPPVILGLAVVFWVAGFDILYACQDYDFDKDNNLYSIPKKIGIPASLWLAKGSHFVAFLLLGYLSWLVPLYFIYTAGLIIIAGLLTYEHALVHPGDLSRLDMAFFRMNGIISIVFFIAVMGDLFLL